MSLIVKVICGFVKSMVTILLIPIDLYIETNLPGVNTVLVNVSNLINWLIPFSKWVLSWLPFSTEFYSFVILSLTFIYTMPIIFNTIKLLIKWWHQLVP